MPLMETSRLIVDKVLALGIRVPNELELVANLKVEKNDDSIFLLIAIKNQNCL